MQTVSWTTEEKVGFPNYSNVVIRATISREISDEADAVEELREVVERVEEVMSPERDKVNQLLVEATS